MARRPLPPGPPPREPDADGRRAPWLQRLLRWLRTDLPEGFPGFEDEPGETSLSAGTAWAEAAGPPAVHDDRAGAPRAGPRGAWAPPGAPQSPAMAAGRVTARQAGAAEPVSPPPAAPPTTASSTPRDVPLRRRRQRHARSARGAGRTLGLGVAALAVLAVVAVAAAGVRLALTPASSQSARPSQPKTPGTRVAPPSRSSSTGGSGSTAAAPAGAATAPLPAGQPNCASMRMLRAPTVGTQPVPGLCDDLGNGSSWLVGCAPGFQRSCDPALHGVILCLRADGARHGGTVTAADVTACAASVAGRGAAVRAAPS